MSHSHPQLRDPAIKLFGRNIPFPDSNISATLQSMDECTEPTKSKVDNFVEKPREPESHRKSNNTYQENEAEASQNSGEEKGLKKPEKLVPCPRCNSLETKFCYFNNYNVNQPRHFCKGCHRYWTAGGTIRNVPVGAGRRRNTKHSSSSSSQTRQTIETNPDISINNESDNNNSNNNKNKNSPLCESMEIKLSLEDQKRAEPGPTSEEPLLSSSCSSPFPQWPCWSAGWSSVPVMTVPGFCPPNVPFQFVPGSYWGYVPGWEGSGSNSGSPTLGKHSRESSTKYLWVPKTLRIDDPNEAAKSSIWSTLGIEPDRNEDLVRSGIFKPYKRKLDTDSSGSDSGQVLQSNPAALCRSNSFQEST